MESNKKEVFVKRVGLGLLLACSFSYTDYAQSLGGIFSQGASGLAQTETQIFALQLLNSTTDAGYNIVENGLTNIDQIHGAEFGLHQAYFSSFSTVNPAVAAMPEVQDIIQTEQSLVTDLSTAIQRWHPSGPLTADGLSMAEQVYERLCQLGAAELGELQNLLTDAKLVLGDAERMGRVRALDAEVRREWVFAAKFGSQADLLIQMRIHERSD
jgi:hypothetical protein